MEGLTKRREELKSQLDNMMQQFTQAQRIVREYPLRMSKLQGQVEEIDRIIKQNTEKTNKPDIGKPKVKNEKAKRKG